VIRDVRPKHEVGVLVFELIDRTVSLAVFSSSMRVSQSFARSRLLRRAGLSSGGMDVLLQTKRTVVTYDALVLRS
jgi:hypothetical protein